MSLYVLLRQNLVIGCAGLLGLILLSNSSFTAMAAPGLGQKLPVINLDGDAGGRTDGTPWCSEMIKDKIWIMFYVDPDKRDLNEDMEAAVKDANFPLDKLGSIGVINMAATWVPNAVINSSLRSKQEKYPDVTYVKDMHRTLVDKWQLTDNDYVVVVFDKKANVIFFKDGRFEKKDTADLLATIRKNI